MAAVPLPLPPLSTRPLSNVRRRARRVAFPRCRRRVALLLSLGASSSALGSGFDHAPRPRQRSRAALQLEHNRSGCRGGRCRVVHPG
eukprot:2286743-Prymnesium_polylepis.1